MEGVLEKNVAVPYSSSISTSSDTPSNLKLSC